MSVSPSVYYTNRRSDWETEMLIQCSSCAMQHTVHCDDCVVRVLLAPAVRRAGVVVDGEEERALRELARAGLIPAIRMRARRTA